MTYRFFSLVPLGSIDRVVVFGNMQMQEVLVWEVFLAFAATVHVKLMVVHIVFLNRSKSKRVVRGQ